VPGMGVMAPSFISGIFIRMELRRSVDLSQSAVRRRSTSTRAAVVAAAEKAAR
jgi:hypothetical protein